MLITPSSLQALQTGFSTAFQGAYKSAPIYWDRIATRIGSSSKTETHGFMARLLEMREWVGPRMLQSLSAHDYVLANKDFELTIGVPRNDIEDDNLGIYDVRFREMGRQAAKWPDYRVLEALQNGESENGFDGQPFFSTTHDLDPAGDQSNLPSATAANALSAAGWEKAQETMASFTGEDGRPLGAYPDLLVVPPQLAAEAKELLVAERAANGATNIHRGEAQMLVLPELAGDPTTWYALDTSGELKPFIFQERQAPQFVNMAKEDDANVFFHRQYIWGVDARGAGGYGPWWLAVKMTTA